MLTLRKVGFQLVAGAALAALLQGAFAQQAKKATSANPVGTGLKGAPTQELPPLLEMISEESARASLQGLATVIRMNTKDLRTNNQVVAGLPVWLSQKPEDRKDAMQRKYVVQYRTAIMHLISGLGSADHEVRFFGGYDKPPVRFAMREGSLAVFLTGIVSTNVFNALRTTESTRAAKVVREFIASELAGFDEAFSGSGVKFYGMIVTYGSKDFSDDDSVAKVEAVTVIVSAARCKQFAEAHITDAELISAGDTYLLEKSGLKKIKVAFE